MLCLLIGALLGHPGIGPARVQIAEVKDRDVFELVQHLLGGDGVASRDVDDHPVFGRGNVHVRAEVLHETLALWPSGVRSVFALVASSDARSARRIRIIVTLPRLPTLSAGRGRRLTELAQCSPDVDARLRELCERDLPEINRHVLSRVMDWIGTREAVVSNLNLIDDAQPSSVPQGVWDQLENAFVERRPHGQSLRVFTLHARASSQLRARLLRMALDDLKRRKSAFMLLGRIELWRLEHGRPTDEPRHPNLASGQP